MDNNLVDRATSAKLILVPKGDDSKPCLAAFQAALGITVPEFEDRKLEAADLGRTFLKVKGRDIPALIAAGYGDIGLTGSDSCEDFMTSDNSIVYQSFGPVMCRLALLAPTSKAAKARKQLKDNAEYLSVATSFPKLLRKYAVSNAIKLIPADITIAGSVEIMPRLLGVPLVADLVGSGATAKANDLVEIQKLADVYPAVVVRNTASAKQNTVSPYQDGISRIDAALAKRSTQVDDKKVSSYTLDLMRDSNKAGKKIGEELSEVLMAIYGDGSLSDCENEIADMVYAQLVAAYSQGKPVKLSTIIRILCERNSAISGQENE